MVEGGLLTEEQLLQAIKDQKKSHLKLGQFLVREGIVGESKSGGPAVQATENR